MGCPTASETRLNHLSVMYSRCQKMTTWGSCSATKLSRISSPWVQTRQDDPKIRNHFPKAHLRPLSGLEALRRSD